MLIDPTDFYIHYNFGMLRDIRIVSMKDAQGNQRDGVFIPFLQNGIKWDRSEPNRSPIQNLIITLHPHYSGVSLYNLRPMISEQYRQRMITEGVLDVNDKVYTDICGSIRKKMK